MFHGNLATCQSGKKIDLRVIEEIISLSLEAIMFFRFNDENDVAGNRVRSLICFASEGNSLTLLHTLVDMNIQHFTFVRDFLAVTFLALVLCGDNFSLSVTVRTQSLESLNHGTHLSHHNLLSGTVTSLARLD